MLYLRWCLCVINLSSFQPKWITIFPFSRIAFPATIALVSSKLHFLQITALLSKFHLCISLFSNNVKFKNIYEIQHLKSSATVISIKGFNFFCGYLKIRIEKNNRNDMYVLCISSVDFKIVCLLISTLF